MENELNDFKDWLKKTGISARACNDVISRLRRIGKEYDVLDEYAKDKCVELLEKFTYTAQNRRNGEEPKVDIIIDGDYCSGISSLKSALNHFVDFLNDIHYCAVVKQSATHAFFYGTLQDFNKNIGPRCRNEVQLICKSERELQGGVCEYCGKQNCVLDSAHVVERPVIIKSILKRYKKSLITTRSILMIFLPLSKKHICQFETIYFSYARNATIIWTRRKPLQLMI